MKPPTSKAPVVVGIDGSQAAIDAARWAAAEALARGVPLRLVHVIEVEDDVDLEFDEDPAEMARDWPETERGRVSLRAASAAAQGTGKPLTIETEILCGEVYSTLIDESKHATMLCVGAVGIVPVCHHLLGSTAATLAEHAHGPLAVVRSPHSTPTSEPDWIITVVDDSAQSDAVVDYALDEAHLRHAPLLALAVPRRGHREVPYDELDRRVATWRHDHPDLRIDPASIPTDIATFLARHDEMSVQLVVVGAVDADQAAAIIGSDRPGRQTPSRPSVLVVR